MFTGIVETIGIVTEMDGNSLSIMAEKFSKRLFIGGSVSVKGACLTITAIENKNFTVDVVDETRRKTNLGDLKISSNVNLELPVPVTGSFDGHIVQGHIDTTSMIDKIDFVGKSCFINFKLSKKYREQLIKKGSITINGVSLTISKILKNGFQIVIIPHTLKHTNLKNLQEMDIVNVEFDLLGKYIKAFSK